MRSLRQGQASCAATQSLGRRAKEPLQMVHLDTMGPFVPVSNQLCLLR
jgi:hypothetical protein